MVGHRVVNNSKGDMLFSIGEHPGFNCPLLDDETMEGYSLVFECKEKISRIFVEEGLLTDKEEVFLHNENEVRLSKALFERRAIILEGLKSNYVSLVSSRSNRKVTVTLKGYPYLGIWSPETGAPFVCIEPWHGVASKKDGSINFEEKEGLIRLEAGKKFECSYKIITD